MQFLKYMTRRIIFLLIMLLGVATMVFVISHMVPSDPVVAHLGQRAMSDPEIVAAFKAKWGLDQPLYVQYWRYIAGLLQGDFGKSIRTGNAITDDLAMFWPATFELATFSIILAAILGVGSGIISAVKRNRLADKITRVISIIGVSMPIFWLSLLSLYVFYFKLGWAPGTGRINPTFIAPADITGLYVIDSILEGDGAKAINCLGHLVLPGLVLAYFTMGLISRTTRSSLLDVLHTDYIRTAQAKGVGSGKIISHHAMGNALIPVLTVIGCGFANLLGGMVLVETIFAWPGIGQYAYQSVSSLDFSAIIGVALLIAVIYVVINLVIDILYGIIDPRVRLQ